MHCCRHMTCAILTLLSYYTYLLLTIIKIQIVLTFSTELGLNANMGTVSTSHVTVATHCSKYLTMCWKRKRIPNGFCSMCADLATVPDLLWGHRKKGSSMDGLDGPDLPLGLINIISITAMQIMSSALSKEYFALAHTGVRWVSNE